MLWAELRDWKWNFLKIVKLNQIWPGRKAGTAAPVAFWIQKSFLWTFQEVGGGHWNINQTEHIIVTASHIPQYFRQGPVWLIPSVWQMSDYVRGDAIMGLMTIHHSEDVSTTTLSPQGLQHRNIETHTLLPFSNFLEINRKHPLLGSLQHLIINIILLFDTPPHHTTPHHHIHIHTTLHMHSTQYNMFIPFDSAALQYIWFVQQ